MKAGWEKQESRLAKDVGGRRTVLSGALGVKGDVRAEGLYVEAKWTGKQSRALKASELEKATREALVVDRVPVFALEINGLDYAILNWNDFLPMWEAYRGQQ